MISKFYIDYKKWKRIKKIYIYKRVDVLTFNLFMYIYNKDYLEMMRK